MIKKGIRFSDDSGIFFSLGGDEYLGASPDSAPLIYSKNGDFFSAGQEIVDPALVNDNAAQFGKPHHKAHLHYHNKGFEFWVRSTRGSIEYDNVRHVIEGEGSFVNSGRGFTYQQLTLAARQEIAFSDQLSLMLDASYDAFDTINHSYSNDIDFKNTAAVGEDELNFRGFLDWEINLSQAVAVGIEYSQEWFGRDADRLSAEVAHLANNILSEWKTQTLSLLAEYQWNMTSQWTVFLGGRADQHTYTPWMYAPKIAVVFSPRLNHTFKLIFNRAVRKSEDPELKRQHDVGQEPDIETIQAVEFRHDWIMTQNLTQGLSIFHYDHSILGFLPQAGRETKIGESTVNGLELEMSYQTGLHKLDFSHGYLRLLDFRLANSDLINQVITAEPYGYGSGLANWSSHISRMTWEWKFKQQWRFDSSLRVYWDFKGAEDYTAYNNEVLGAINRSQSDGRTDAFDASVFLNAGLNYHPNHAVRCFVNFYNVLGIVNKKFNKRNFYARMAGYRAEAVAASFGFEARF